MYTHKLNYTFIMVYMERKIQGPMPKRPEQNNGKFVSEIYHVGIEPEISAISEFGHPNLTINNL